jgi:hypothetical protein
MRPATPGLNAYTLMRKSNIFTALGQDSEPA